MPDVFGLTVAQLETFFFIFLRVSVMLSIFPIFSSVQIPRLARVGFGLLIAFVLYGSVPLMTPLTSFYDLLAATVSQALLGMIVGFVASLVFLGVQFAGEIIDIEIGFAVANIISPQTQQQVTVIGEFQLTIATLLFLISDAHHLLLQGISGSFNVLPLPYIALHPAIAGNVTIFLSSAISDIVKIAAPPAVALFLTNVALAFMARVAPQMNVFVVGFPIQVGIGLILIAVSLPILGDVMPQMFAQVPQQMNQIMQDLRV